ncbi:MAG TPA: orotate phosphoribosyltransferase [Polyangiales bacterium]|nr:orotate phosphoribosyltransferase [Polyangiales bacterium]
MQDYKRQFIEFMVQCEVLRFGDFTAKSGRKTPYFVNTGRYRTGAQLARLSRFYAQTLRAELGAEFDVLFGPAYKGIPLAAATAMALHEDYGHEVGFCFNRKETKDHGEGGSLVGHTLQDGDRVVIIEDVTTAGSSIRETVPLLQAAAKVKLTALIVSVDRMERGTGHIGALREIGQTFGMRTFAIVTVDEIIEHLRATPIDGRILLDDATYRRMLDYRAAYGAS